MNICKLIGHKFVPVYIEGWYGKKHVKFIGTYCCRCGFGNDELHYTIAKMTGIIYNTYSEKYFYKTELMNKKNRSTKYQNRCEIRIGDYVLSYYHNNNFLLAHKSGEGMEVGKQDIIALIDNFYKENF